MFPWSAPFGAGTWPAELVGGGCPSRSSALVPCVKEEPRVSEISGFEQDGQPWVGFGFQPRNARGDFPAHTRCRDAKLSDHSPGGLPAGDDELPAAYGDESFGDCRKAAFGYFGGAALSQERLRLQDFLWRSSGMDQDGA